MPITVARLDDPVHRIVDDRLGGQARRHLDLRDLDELAFAGAAPVLEGGQQRDARVHPDDRVSGPLQGARRTVRVTRDSGHARRSARN